MSIFNILQHKDMLSNKKATDVKDILSDEVQKIIDKLIFTSYTLGGYGLAAPQVGINKQIFVYRKSIIAPMYTYNVIINPSIVIASGKLISKNEGCLSILDQRVTIKRFKTFVLRCKDRNNVDKRIKGKNHTEIIILQHEYDHLIGKTILNY